MMTRRLTLLNASYFEATRQRQEANEELKIQNSLIEIVSQAANYPEPLFMSILQEGGHFVDMAFGMTVLRMLAVSEYGLREGDLRQLLGNDWDALKFAELRRYLGPLLTTDSVSGIIDFAIPTSASRCACNRPMPSVAMLRRSPAICSKQLKTTHSMR